VEYGGEDIAEGHGSSKKDAKLQAAERALRSLYGSTNDTRVKDLFQKRTFYIASKFYFKNFVFFLKKNLKNSRFNNNM